MVNKWLFEAYLSQKCSFVKVILPLPLRGLPESIPVGLDLQPARFQFTLGVDLMLLEGLLAYLNTAMNS